MLIFLSVSLVKSLMSVPSQLRVQWYQHLRDFKTCQLRAIYFEAISFSQSCLLNRKRCSIFLWFSHCLQCLLLCPVAGSNHLLANNSCNIVTDAILQITILRHQLFLFTRRIPIRMCNWPIQLNRRRQEWAFETSSDSL